MIGQGDMKSGAGMKAIGAEQAAPMFFMVTGFFLIVASFLVSTASALTYSKGSYGTCQYDSCSISVGSSGEVNLSLMSGAGTSCSVTNDAVIVSTRSSTGYNVTLSTITPTQTLTGLSNSETIDPINGTDAAPVTLEPNTWGYRVDDGNFGVGPTSSMTNVAVPSLTFAEVPSPGYPSYVASFNAAATNATTNVWYGVCVDNAKVADTYTNDIVYTAAIN